MHTFIIILEFSVTFVKKSDGLHATYKNNQLDGRIYKTKQATVLSMWMVTMQPKTNYIGVPVKNKINTDNERCLTSIAGLLRSHTYHCSRCCLPPPPVYFFFDFLAFRWSVYHISFSFISKTLLELCNPL